MPFPLVVRSVSRTGVLAALALLVSLLVAPGAAHAFIDRDCSDFATQADAQRFFLAEGGPTYDPHRLDGNDKDGLACESRPCPCLHSTSGGSGSTATAPRTGSAKKTKKVVKQDARVVRVVDGDTLVVRLAGGKQQRVRLIGIDTPEVHGRRECWGAQASAAAKKMLRKGTKVRLVSDPTQDSTDRYGRALRYVTRTRDGLDVNRHLVRKGHARVYVYAGKPFQRTTSYRAAQQKAKKARIGLWKSC